MEPLAIHVDDDWAWSANGKLRQGLRALEQNDLAELDAAALALRQRNHGIERATAGLALGRSELFAIFLLCKGRLPEARSHDQEAPLVVTIGLGVNIRLARIARE
eukprot:4016000-Prymnesium_polylepis.2